MQIATITSIGSGVCWCHPPASPIPMIGMVLTGATRTEAEGKLMARIGDIVIGNCGHVSMIITGSTRIDTEGRPQARVTDQFMGCFQGMIITGCIKTEGI
jgi:uncharacterized Zn-binding protein involved in type VI secretion